MAAAERVRNEEWDRTSHLMALLANCNRGKNQRAYNPDDFHPFRRRRRRRRSSYTTDRIAAEHASLAATGKVKVRRITSDQVVHA